MKRLLLLLLLTCFLNGAVFLNGVNLDEVDCHYLTVEIDEDLRKTQVYADCGRDEPEHRRRVTDKEGETKLFHSVSGALNFFCRNGWEIKDIYTKSSRGSDVSSTYTSTTHYVLQRGADI
ncbi:MAG: hypothetical protein U5N56_03980 [Candidatus Marinimicrobia bacterium]|nr:hypothetical protein [Candidatus Neomarinimicrobiota bacterium]